MRAINDFAKLTPIQKAGQLKILVVQDFAFELFPWPAKLPLDK
jgi:hypothetical protein